MQIEGYALTKTSDQQTFYFDNEGPFGKYKMAIVYAPHPDYLNTYNLGFGVVTREVVNGLEVYDIRDDIETKNDNLVKIIATVAHSLLLFWELHPQENVFFRGSDFKRGVLYNRVVRNYGRELDGYANIYGVKGENIVPYDLVTMYDAHIIEPLIIDSHEEMAF